MNPKYKRILLKLSGEALAGVKKTGLDADILNVIAKKVKECLNMGVEVAIVVGGGNFFRGRTSDKMDRIKADHMGMLATVINSLAVSDALENAGVSARVMTAIEMKQIAETYTTSKAKKHLESGKVVIFGCGTGNPFFSTDTAAALRAVEIGADAILLAKNVDAVYDSDPNINPNAKKYDKITFKEVLSQGLGVMDTTASSLCMDNDIKIRVFGLNDPDNIIRVIKGEEIGTLVY